MQWARGCKNSGLRIIGSDYGLKRGKFGAGPHSGRAAGGRGHGPLRSRGEGAAACACGGVGLQEAPGRDSQGGRRRHHRPGGRGGPALRDAAHPQHSLRAMDHEGAALPERVQLLGGAEAPLQRLGIVRGACEACESPLHRHESLGFLLPVVRHEMKEDVAVLLSIQCFQTAVWHCA